ncbi:protein-glutamate O-methyltransferase CheR [Spongiibacter sp. KMU-158]|uniref:Chemotaxis protein methyltransferase n=1 Tax=Spongiibacter pelagi TaxID=2760804 RepID=A0A927BYY4_9GAMM|nr:protein-glutamate O-methyltransferase CheR [Spongiibacter pelagi]
MALENEKSNLEFNFSKRDFERLRKLVYEHTGINLSEEKQQLTYGRFAKRLRALKISDFSDYIDLIDNGDEDEMDHFVSAITTNFTSFFRESHHFDFLAQEVQRIGMKSRRIRIWSAGCSSGEEPYSIAISILNAIPDAINWDLKILATDLDKKMVEKASAGIYDAERISGLPEQIKKGWFRKGRGDNAGKVQVAKEARSLITFKDLNLLHDWPVKGPFDIIFCRNVVIYFDKGVQRTLFSKFSAKQRSGGKLIIGHSENLANVSNDYKLIGRTIYEKL